MIQECVKSEPSAEASPAEGDLRHYKDLALSLTEKLREDLLHPAGAILGELLLPGLERPCLKRVAHLLHDLKVEGEVVDRVEARAEDLAYLVEMMQIGAREVATRVAVAARIKRTQIVAVTAVLELHVAETGEEPAVARIAGGHHAVEHVDALGDAGHEVLGRAHAHQVARTVVGELVHDVVHDAEHVLLGLADGKAAHGIAVEADVLEALERLLTQVLEHAALDDAEECVRVLETIELVTRALRPAKAHAHRLGGLELGGGTVADLVGRALVEHHHHVGVEHALDLHRHFGRQEELVAVDRIAELHAFLGDLPQFAKAEDLKAARVGQDGLVPLHEVVKTVVGPNHLEPGTQPQVEGVAEDDLGADLLEFIGRHRLHGTVGADRHEDRRLNDAVIERQFAATGSAARRLDLEIKSHVSLVSLSCVQVLLAGSACKTGVFDEACVAVAEEAVLLLNGMAVGLQNALAARKGGDQHDERRLRKMEVRDERVDDAEAIAGHDEEYFFPRYGYIVFV